jgi:hypothetical protein
VARRKETVVVKIMISKIRALCIAIKNPRE